MSFMKITPGDGTMLLLLSMICLFETEKQIQVRVYSIQEDGSEQIIFDGILTPENTPRVRVHRTCT